MRVMQQKRNISNPIVLLEACASKHEIGPFNERRIWIMRFLQTSQPPIPPRFDLNFVYGDLLDCSDFTLDRSLRSLRMAHVGPGEVDDELEEEVGSESAKYGTVTRVLIFEITEPNFPADEAVRIFVQFERSEETTKALIDLDGRYFGGRVVRATFYDEEKFGNNELAPMPGEIPGYP
ncbi:hypothetical protein RJ641_001704 [Dillenia turbinata]|uniref:RRM domain-containing protein n=1 Tax=Dillenia turbinata TaxID=194707 RepID=A0AAN8VD08_9MAGN